MKIGSKEIDLIKIYILIMSFAVLALGIWVFLTYRTFDAYRNTYLRQGKSELENVVRSVETLSKNYELTRDKTKITNWESETAEIFGRLKDWADKANIGDAYQSASRKPKGNKDWQPYKPRKSSRQSKGPNIEQKIYEISFQKSTLSLENIVQFLFNIENRSEGMKVVGIKTKKIDPVTFLWESPVVDIAFYRKAERKSKR